MPQNKIKLLRSARLISTPIVATADVAYVLPPLETPDLGKAVGETDADDSAYWVRPADAAKPLMITAVKDGGPRVPFTFMGPDLNAVDGDIAASNFKQVDWATIAGSFERALNLNAGHDPCQ